MGMAGGWLKRAHEDPRPVVSLSPAMTVEEHSETSIHGAREYYTLMAEAVAALDPNTEDARRRLYERARAALLTEFRSAEPSDMIAPQMLLELAIGEVEAGAQRDPHAPLVASPSTQPACEPERAGQSRGSFRHAPSRRSAFQPFRT